MCVVENWSFRLR